MIAAAFISRNDDWIIAHKLRVLSTFCDAIFVLLDRSPQSEAICRRFPKCQVRHWQPTAEAFPMAHDGPTWDEGAMRQAVWDWAMESKPERVILGDTDEIPAPSLIDEMLSTDAEMLYAAWPNLIHDVGHAIDGPNSVWSYTRPTSNKKGVMVRPLAGEVYRYKFARRHVRMEPSPLDQCRAIVTPARRLAAGPLVHYKWANWPRWEVSEQAKLPYYRPWPDSVARIERFDARHIHLWSADDYLRDMAGSIAVVGNGSVIARGREIDAHDHVIRFNNFKLDAQHVPHVGSKTTLWVSNIHDSVAPREWPGDMMTCYSRHEQKKLVASSLAVHPQMSLPLDASWYEAARKVKQREPTTGLVLLCRMLNYGKQVDAYGFDGLSSGHYWDGLWRHNHTQEVEAILYLASRGVRFNVEAGRDRSPVNPHGEQADGVRAAVGESFDPSA